MQGICEILAKIALQLFKSHILREKQPITCEPSPRPLNVPQAQSLYAIERASDKDTSQSYPDYLDLRDRNRSFGDLSAHSITQVALDTGENPSLVWGVEASGNCFDAVWIQPFLGRFFHASDERGPNSAPHMVLSYAYWHSHFHDDRGVVGRIVQLNHSMLGGADLRMAGYSSDRVPAMQKRMMDAVATIPGVEPPCSASGSNRIAERLFPTECLGKALKGNGCRGAVRHNSAVRNILRELRAL